MGDSLPSKSKAARVKQAIARLLDAAKLQPHAQSAKTKSAKAPKGKSK